MIEGKKRQIRRVAAILGHPVKSLMRTHIGQLGLGTLRRGEYYELNDEEVKAMMMPADELKFIYQRRQRNRRRTYRPDTSSEQ
jgi:16S rRNA U516 pseudouridylate synthase RsuA-like enzyme